MINNVKQKAITITQEALDSLYNAKDELQHASNWGIFDIVGGGFLASGAKHLKLLEAADHIHRAQNILRDFNYDYSQKLGVNDIEEVKTNDLTGILDVFADNPFSDISMQSRIEKTLRQVDSSIRKVEYMLNGLTN